MSYGHSITITIEYEEEQEPVGEEPPETKQIKAKYFALDPSSLMKHLLNEGKPTEQLAKCNRVILPAGREYGRAWLLMRGTDARELFTKHRTALNKFCFTISLFPKELNENVSIDIKKMALAHVYSINSWNHDYLDDPEYSQHFVVAEFVDARYIAKMSDVNWSVPTTTHGYAPTYPGVKDYNLLTYRFLDDDNNIDYYLHSLDVQTPGSNVGVPWTWERLVEDLWNCLPRSYPEVATDPFYESDFSGAVYPDNCVPQNIRLVASNIFDTLCEILYQTQNVLWRDNNGKWFITSYSKYPEAPNYSDKNKFLENSSWDLPRWPDPSDPSNQTTMPFNVLLPEKIRVYFPTTQTHFSSINDETTVDGGDAFFVFPLETINTADYTSVYAVKNTSISLIAPMSAIFSESGLLAPPYESGESGNFGEHNDCAHDYAHSLVELWFKARMWTEASLNNTYMYYHDISCGAEISAVHWYNTGGGAKTEILRNPFKYRPGDELNFMGRGHREEVLSWENFKTPNVTRQLPPVTKFAIATIESDLEPYKSDSSISPSLAVVMGGTYSPNSKNMLVGGTGKKIRVYNLTNFKIKKNAIVFCFWHVQSRRWLVLFSERATKFYTGTLKHDMCPGDLEGISTDIRGLTDCEDTCGSGSGSDGFQVTLLNQFKLAGQAGDKFLAYHDDCVTQGMGGNVSSMTDICVIFQVQHRAADLVEHPFVTTTPDCETAPEDMEFEGCGIDYKFRSYSVMTCKATPTQQFLLGGTYTKVLSRWWVDGLCIKGEYTHIWTLCQCPGYDTVLHAGVDCAGGSCGETEGGIL